MVFCELCGKENDNSYSKCLQCGNSLIMESELVSPPKDEITDEKIMTSEVELYPPTNENRHQRQDFVKIAKPPRGGQVTRDEDMSFEKNVGDDINRIQFVKEFGSKFLIKGISRTVILNKKQVPLIILIFLFISFNIINNTVIVALSSELENHFILLIFFSFVPLSIILVITWNYNLGFPRLSFKKINTNHKCVSDLGLIMAKTLVISIIYASLFYSSSLIPSLLSVDSALNFFGYIILHLLVIFLITRLSLAPGLLVNNRSIIASMIESWEKTSGKVVSLFYTLTGVMVFILGFSSGLASLLTQAYIAFTFENMDLIILYVTFPLYLLFFTSAYLLYIEVEKTVVNGKLWDPR